MLPDLWSSDGRIGDSSTNSRHGITVAWIEAGIIRDLDAIACIESAKSDITCYDSYIVSFLNFVARHNKFIDNNINLRYVHNLCMTTGAIAYYILEM